ncbi:MAG: hypothetical protein NTZ74_09700 [Chloroflexi bacterium]|nr:hypothetical protein [Chloroflexota bacterium]
MNLPFTSAARQFVVALLTAFGWINVDLFLVKNDCGASGGHGKAVVESYLADCNLERGPGCEWWFEAGELVDDEGELVGCQDCRED